MLESSKAERTVVIGDVHGCRQEFEELLYLVDSKSPHVRVILLSDLIDRGPDSVGCVRLAREMNLEAVMANHEAKFLKWYRNKGSRSDVYDKPSHYSQLTDDDINYIARMPNYIKLDNNFVVVHAGLRPGIPLEQQSKDDLLYIRYVEPDGKFVSLRKINKLGSKEAANAHFWTTLYDGAYNVIYGHNVVPEPRIDRFPDKGTACYGIDTGLVFGNKLTAMIVETKEFIQVPAKQVYYTSTFEVR